MAKRRPARRPSRRHSVRSRAYSCCEYCRLPDHTTPIPFHVEHVIPRKHRGRTVLSNLAYSCPDCNFSKAANIAGIDEPTGGLTRLFHPRIDEWSEHFMWEDAALLGKTAIGRTTIDVLSINDAERLRHRELLIQLGEFPPDIPD